MTANLVLAGNDSDVINETLQNYLKDQLSGGIMGVRGSREKTITVLMRIWQRVPADLCVLKNDGLQLLQRLTKEEHIAVHWGMMLAVYPFWGSVATFVGRLLEIQEVVTTSQVVRRMKEQYGDRHTVERATQRAMNSFELWGIIKPSDQKSSYILGDICSIGDPRLITWVIEALLNSMENDSAVLRDLLRSPTLFPLRLDYISAEQLVAYSSSLDTLRHGLDEDMIILKHGAK